MTQGQNFDFRDRSFFMDRGGAVQFGGGIPKNWVTKGEPRQKFACPKGGGGGHPKINFAATIYV